MDNERPLTVLEEIVCDMCKATGDTSGCPNTCLLMDAIERAVADEKLIAIYTYIRLRFEESWANEGTKRTDALIASLHRRIEGRDTENRSGQ